MPERSLAHIAKQETANGRTGGTSFTNGGAADVAPGFFGIFGQDVGGRDDDPVAADQPGGRAGRGADGRGEQCGGGGRGRGSDELRLLALLRLRRLPVRLLRRGADLVSAGYGGVADVVGGDVPASDRRQGIHHRVSRLLR